MKQIYIFRFVGAFLFKKFLLVVTKILWNERATRSKRISSELMGGGMFRKFSLYKTILSVGELKNFGLIQEKFLRWDLQLIDEMVVWGSDERGSAKNEENFFGRRNFTW